MLAHFCPAAALTHDALLHASCVHGVADLHALITARLAYAQASAQPAPLPSELAWALALCPAALFHAAEVRLGPDVAGAGGAAAQPQATQLPLWPADPSTGAPPGAPLMLAPTLPEALAVLDALVALGAARLLPVEPNPAAAEAALLLSARERAALAAAWQVPSWPKVRLSPAFSPLRAVALGRRRGKALRQILAKLELLHRPLHLWLGPHAPTSLLSPYVRETKAALLSAAPARLLSLGVPGPWPAGPNLAYALAERLPAVAEERANAEAQVGIKAVSLLGLSLEVIDAGALSPATWDERLSLPQSPPWRSAAEAPVIVCCPLLAPKGSSAVAAPGLEAAGLLAALGPCDLQEICIGEPAAPSGQGDMAAGNRLHAQVHLAGTGAAWPLPLLTAGPGPAVAQSFAATWQPAVRQPLGLDSSALAQAMLEAAPKAVTWASLQAAAPGALAASLSLASHWLARILAPGCAP